MIIIDTNALVVLLVGTLDIKLLKEHKRTSIYEEADYHGLSSVIGDLNRLLVLPNVWTETDNLLNNFSGNYKYPYITTITKMIKATTEKFLESSLAAENDYFFDLGITDSLILTCAKECDLLITSDSALSDYALGNGIKVYDMVKIRNERL